MLNVALFIRLLDGVTLLGERDWEMSTINFRQT